MGHSVWCLSHYIKCRLLCEKFVCREWTEMWSKILMWRERDSFYQYSGCFLIKPIKIRKANGCKNLLAFFFINWWFNKRQLLYQICIVPVPWSHNLSSKLLMSCLNKNVLFENYTLRVKCSIHLDYLMLWNAYYYAIRSLACHFWERVYVICFHLKKKKKSSHTVYCR